MKVYYKYDDNNSYVVYDRETQKIECIKKRPTIGYEMLNGFGCEATHEGLKKYYTALEEKSNELEEYLRNDDYMKTKNGHSLDMDLSFFHSNGNNTSLMRRLFFLKRADDKETRKDYEHVSFEEYRILNELHGSGLMAGQKYEGKCYGYDVNSFYGRLMGHVKGQHKFKFPVKKGTITTLKELPSNKELMYGAYRVKITSTNPRTKFYIGIKKKCKYQWFSHYDIKLARYIKEKSPELDIDIDLVVDNKPNALMYKESDLIMATDIFKHYFNLLIYAKDRLMNNPLPKLLLNSIYGCQKIKYNPMKITSKKYEKYSDDEKNKYIMDYSKEYINDKGEIVHYLLRRDRIFKYKIARVGYFLPCKGRNYIANKIYKLGDDVIRVHTDGFITKTPHKFQYPITPEDKYYDKYIKMKNVVNIKVKCSDGKYRNCKDIKELLF